jgi:hypothetical protein
MPGPTRGSASGLRACALALALPLALPGSAFAGLVLRDSAPRTITYEQLKAGRARVVVCDDGAGSARDLRIRFERFGLQQEGQPISVRDALQPPRAPRTLRSGRCAALHVALRSHITITRRAYRGSLAISSTAGAVRLALTLVGPDPNAPVPVVPAAAADATLELHIERSAIGLHPHLLGGGVLPVRASVAGRTPELPVAGTVIGMLVDDTHRAVVRVADPRPRRDSADPDVWLLPVTVSGADTPGTYTGTLDLAPAAAADPTVPAKLTVSDNWLRRALAVALGALAAFVVQLWVRNWRVAFRWWRRLRQLRDAYVDAGVDFGTSASWEVDPPTPGSVWTYTNRIRRTIKQSSSWFAFFDSGSEAYQGVVKSLSYAEEDIRCLRLELRSHLYELQSATRLVLAVLAYRSPQDEAPACVTRAAGLLSCGALGVGGAQKLAKLAERHTSYLLDWKLLFERALEYETICGQLAVAKKNGGVGTTGDDARQLDATRAKLQQALVELFEAEDRDAFEATGKTAKLDAVGNELSVLRQVYQRAAQSAVTLNPHAGALVAQRHQGPSAADVRGRLRDLIRVADGVYIRDAQPVGSVERVRQFGDLLVLAFSFAVGVVATLVVVDSGATAGSGEDYLVAFAAGATSQVVISLLSELRDSDRQAAKVIEPEPAWLEVTP